MDLGDDGGSIAKNDDKGSEKVGNGRPELKSALAPDLGKSLSEAELGNTQSIATSTSGNSSTTSLIDFPMGVLPGDNLPNSGHGKGNGSLLGAVDALGLTSEDILSGSSGKDKKPKK